MNIRTLTAVAAALLFFPVAQAASNPTLGALVDGVEDESARASLPLRGLDIDAVIDGSIARTTITATFGNTTDEVLSGEFSLALPAGAVVTGYALDIKEKMVDGVLADVPRATAIYEDKVRRGIDPGIAEVSRDNVFATRVYPILPEKGRTIRLTFAAPILPEQGLTLPLLTEVPVDRLSITLRAFDVVRPPEVSLPLGATVRWRREGAGFRASLQAPRAMLAGDLRIADTEPRRELLESTHPSGGRFFQLRTPLPALKAEQRAPERLRIYWDRSRSRRDDRIGAELELLDQFVAAVVPETIDMITFNSTGANLETIKNASEIRDALKDQVYRGGTSFAVLEGLKAPRAELCLMFSDGIPTIDDGRDFKPDCEMIAITSAPDANVGFLRRFSDDVLRLGGPSSNQSIGSLLEQLRSRSPRVVEVHDFAGTPLRFTVLAAGDKELFIVGEAPLSGDVYVSIQSAGSRRYDKAFASTLDQLATFEGPGALWAATRIAELEANDEREALRKLSRQFSISGTTMAFLVLDTPEDYAYANITPPSTLSSADLDIYREAKEEYDAERRDRRQGRLAEVLQRWEEQRAWWSQDFDITAKYEPPAARSSVQSGSYDSGSYDSSGRRALEEVIVTAQRRAEAVNDIGMAVIPLDPESEIEIKLEPWQPDRPYLKVLDAAPHERLDATLAEQEAIYGSVPAFYLDVAEWLQRHERPQAALEFLLSSLELPTRNDETLMVVANRLLRYQAFDRAVWLHEAIARLTPDRPQSLRSLALALVQRAASSPRTAARRDLRRALDLFNQVILTPWDYDNDGIELISLMEANALIPRLRDLGQQRFSLDRRLISLLDVNVRVVIEWNTAATDMDLWVDEPSGERAIYSRPRTLIGGRLSNDMTSGYGPEEYLLRRAPEGRFRVLADVYARDVINPNGATVITVRIFRDFGRPSQREEVIDLELTPGDNGEKLIGELLVKKTPQRELIGLQR